MLVGYSASIRSDGSGEKLRIPRVSLQYFYRKTSFFCKLTLFKQTFFAFLASIIFLILLHCIFFLFLQFLSQISLKFISFSDFTKTNCLFTDTFLTATDDGRMNFLSDQNGSNLPSRLNIHTRAQISRMYFSALQSDRFDTSPEFSPMQFSLCSFSFSHRKVQLQPVWENRTWTFYCVILSWKNHFQDLE